MKGMFAIAAADIRQHRLVIWVALVLGILPLVLNYAVEGKPLRPAGPGEPQPGGEFFVFVLGWVLSIAVGFGLGFDAFSGDLRDRRLGFWLSRPLPLLQYWAGKLLAALLLAVIGGALVLLPANLVGALSSTSDAFLLRDWRPILGLLSASVAAGSVLGGALRAHGALLALDIVMVPVTWAAIAFSLGGTWQAGTGQAVMLFGVPRLALVAIAVLFAASATQVCVGRLDLRRGHALLSAITWGGLLLFFVGGIHAFSRYVASETASDLRLPHGVQMQAPTVGSQVLLLGTSTRWSYHYTGGYLVDETGRAEGLGGLEGVDGWAWSQDGRHFAWSRDRLGPDSPDGGRPIPDAFGWGPSVAILNLDAQGASARRLPRVDLEMVTALSPSGQRVLLSLPRRGEKVLAVESGQILAAVEDTLRWTRPVFLSETLVRALRPSRRPAPAAPQGDLVNRLVQPMAQALLGEADAAARLIPVEQATVVDWDLATGKVTERGTIALQGARGYFSFIVPTPDWGKVLRIDGSGFFLHDLDGRIAATFVNGWESRARAAGPLSGDRYGCFEEGPSGLRLRVFDGSGRTLVDTTLRGRFPVKVGGEPVPGLLAVGVAPLSDEGERATLFVELANGDVKRREPGLFPGAGPWEFANDLNNTYPVPGSFATKLLLGDDGLVSLDPGTGAKTVVVARRSRLTEN